MKLGIVGTGVIAQEVLPLVGSWGWQPAALCGTLNSASKVQELCEQNNLPAGYTDYAVMLREADIDTVYVAVPNSCITASSNRLWKPGKASLWKSR